MDIVQGTCPLRLSSSRAACKENSDLVKPTASIYQLLGVYHTVDPYLRPLRSSLGALYAKAFPLLLPILNRLAIFAHDSPAIITLALFLLVLAISLQILNFARRVVVFWTKVFAKLVFYGVLLVLAMTVYQRGLMETAGDLLNWGTEIGEVWMREYRRWDGYQNQQQKMGHAAPKYSNAGTGWR